MNRHILDIQAQDLRQMWRERPADGHKGTFGHALLVAGCKGMGGAAVLAAEACLRSGIGKLSVLTAMENHAVLHVAVPEAVLKLDHDVHEGMYNAIGMGPGMGQHAQGSDALLHTLLQSVQSPMVLDADALNMLSANPEWQELIPSHSILTPHPKEAERLMGSNKLDDVAHFARIHRISIVLKGHPTHVFDADGQEYVLNVGNAGMATAGRGDVLTGLVTGLLAQGYAPLEAALLGVWLHGTAGDYCRDEMGENCMLARDIIRHLPDAFRMIGNK